MRPDRRIRDRRGGPAGGRASRRDAWNLEGRPVEPGADGFDADVIPLHGATAGLEPELAALSAELAIAGARARAGTSIGRVESDDELAPSAAFAADLRARLLAQLPEPAVTGAVAGAARSAPSAGPVTFDRVAVPGTHRRVRSTLFDQLAAPRWTALAAAAVIVFAAVGLATDRVTPIVPEVRIASAGGASIVHDGAARAATPGATLAVGDVVRVADDGEATITIDASEARLGPGASIEVDEVDASAIELVQLSGRVFHRVDVPAGQTYAVRTASVTWTARGTAFDIDRAALGSGAERVTVLAVQHAIAIDGPDLDGSLTEGRRAVVILGGATPDVALGEIDAATLADPWLVANARRDRAEGRPLGILAGLDLGESNASSDPLVQPFPSEPASPAVGPLDPSGEPVAPPEPTSSGPAETKAPTPKPTPRPTPKPTPEPTPEPTPTPRPTPALLGLSAFACPGGVLLDWSTYGGDGFAKAVVLRSASESIPAAWPPSGGATAIETAMTTNPAKTDGHHATPDGGATTFYRALVLGGSGQVLAVSPVRSAVTSGIVALGELSAMPESGGLALGWTPFDGPGDCFTTYKVVWSATSTTPSYLGDHDGAVAVAGLTTSSANLDGFASGSTVHVRVQAIRITSLGAFVAAQTGVADVTFP